MLTYMLISLLLGAATEAAARLFKLWRYAQPQTALLNVVAVYGGIMGGIAGLAPRLGVWKACALAAGVGLAYEIANLRILHWWHFPGERLLFIRGHHAIVLVLAALWGVLPLVTLTARAAIKRPFPAATVAERVEQLNVQEQRLLETLDGIREKERSLEARLEGVRRKKQMLLERRAIRDPRAHPPSADNR
jgi:hypothetical protein